MGTKTQRRNIVIIQYHFVVNYLVCTDRNFKSHVDKLSRNQRSRVCLIRGEMFVRIVPDCTTKYCFPFRFNFLSRNDYLVCGVLVILIILGVLPVLWQIQRPYQSQFSAEYNLLFLFQFPVSSLFLKVIQYLLTSSSSSPPHFYFSVHISFNKMFRSQFLCNV